MIGQQSTVGALDSTKLARSQSNKVIRFNKFISFEQQHRHFPNNPLPLISSPFLILILSMRYQLRTESQLCAPAGLPNSRTAPLRARCQTCFEAAFWYFHSRCFSLSLSLSLYFYQSIRSFLCVFPPARLAVRSREVASQYSQYFK